MDIAKMEPQNPICSHIKITNNAGCIKVIIDDVDMTNEISWYRITHDINTEPFPQIEFVARSDMIKAGVPQLSNIDLVSNGIKIKGG